MAKKLFRKGFRFRLKTNAVTGQFLSDIEDACRALRNKVWWINKHRLLARIPILRYREMAFFLTLWKKSDELSFLRDVPSQLLQQTLMDLDRAYRDGFDKHQARKRLPRYKRRQDPLGFRFPQGFRFDNRRVFLPKIGWLGFFKSQEIPEVAKSITVRRRAGAWHASVLVEQELPIMDCVGDAVGIDMGVAKLATLSDGTVYATKRAACYEQKLIREQQRLSRKKKGSKNQAQNILVVQKSHQKIASVRNDYLHKVTNEVSSRYAIAFVEDLLVSNMSRSARGTRENPGRNVAAKSGLNRAILAQGFREFRRQLEYKFDRRGGKIIAVDPRYTSQTCSRCEFVSSDNRTSQACFRCLRCGFELNADLNAARNILKRGLMLMAAGQAVAVCGEVPLGTSVKQKPVKNRKKVSPLVFSCEGILGL